MSEGVWAAEVLRLWAFVVLTTLGSRVAIRASDAERPATVFERLFGWMIRLAVATAAARALGYL